MGCLVRERVTEQVSSVPVAFPRPSLGVAAFGVVTFEKVALEKASVLEMIAFETPWLEMVALEKPWLEKAAFASMMTSSDML